MGWRDEAVCLVDYDFWGRRVQDRVSLCNRALAAILELTLDKAGLELGDPPASASRVLCGMHHYTRLSGTYFRDHTGKVCDLNRQVVTFREKRNQIMLRLGVYMSGRGIVSHRNRDMRQYSEIVFGN